ncbi:hypothetical protein ACFC4S_27195 [Priestia megaterium]|uniref:hypothetical protein n=1 Tax=Priestia megaterium TaxID=1404 RepID=UPI001DDF9B39|nr:hypothetical protein [Priestia megaterium]
MFTAFSKAIIIALSGAIVWMVYSYFKGGLNLSLKEMLKQIGFSAFFILVFWKSLEYSRS